MKIGRIDRTEGERVEMNMTPMTDVCFQLIIFFMLSLRFFSPEGDFNVKMPLSGPSEGPADPNQLPTIKVRLLADASGELAGVRMNEVRLKGLDELRTQVRGIIHDASGSGTAASPEVELDCDYNLKYEHTVRAITAISGFANPDGSVVKLVEKVKFAPRRVATGT